MTEERERYDAGESRQELAAVVRQALVDYGPLRQELGLDWLAGAIAQRVEASWQRNEKGYRKLGES